MNRHWTAFDHGAPIPLGLGGTIAPEEVAFSWGYLDLIDPRGDGVVLIWGYALPFLPGTLARERAGRPEVPREAPSVALSVYEAGRPTFYLLQRQDPVGSADPFLPRIELDALTLDLRDGVRAEVHAPLPGGGRVEGVLELDGPPTRLQVPGWASGPSDHRWAPRRLGRARADLRSGDWSFRMEGAGYHDGNVSRSGLDALGIARWTWGRLPHPGGDRIFYLVERTDGRCQHTQLDVDPQGGCSVEEPAVQVLSQARGRWGLPHPRALRFEGTEVRVRSVVDDGPFYQRFVVEGSVDGTPSVGVMEQVEVGRMDRGWTAPLTRMAVHDPRAPSPFCGLFNGPHRGGVGRVLRQWSGRGRITG